MSSITSDRAQDEGPRTRSKTPALGKDHDRAQDEGPRTRAKDISLRQGPQPSGRRRTPHKGKRHQPWARSARQRTLYKFQGPLGARPQASTMSKNFFFGLVGRDDRLERGSTISECLLSTAPMRSFSRPPHITDPEPDDYDGGNMTP